MMTSRREFLLQSGAGLASAALLTDNLLRLNVETLRWPAGLQLYTVKEQLGKDYDGTLAKVAAIGYKEVETANFFNQKPAEIKKSLDDAGLHCGSIHFGAPAAEAIEFAATIGAKYIVTSIIPPKRITQVSQRNLNAYSAVLKSLTLDEYKSMAEQFNRIGEQAKKAELQLGYHNHNVEFKPLP